MTQGMGAGGSVAPARGVGIRTLLFSFRAILIRFLGGWPSTLALLMPRTVPAGCALLKNTDGSNWFFQASDGTNLYTSAALSAPVANTLYDIVWTNSSLQLKLNGSVVATSTAVPSAQAMCFNLAVGDNSSGDSGYYRMDYVGTTAVPSHRRSC